MSKEGRVFSVPITGIIGVGKSTAVKRLYESGALQKAVNSEWPEGKQSPFVCVMFEPVDMWRERGWLKAFYDDTSANAASFQFIVFDTHVDAVEEAIANARSVLCAQDTPERDILLLTDRSMYDQRLFWELQTETPGLASATPIYNEAYLRIWSKWRRLIPEPSLILFFTTSDIQIAMRRMKSRARPEEVTATDESIITKVGGVTLKYQEELLSRHELWYTEPVAHPSGAPEDGVVCFHIDADMSYHDDGEALRLLAKITARVMRMTICRPN